MPAVEINEQDQARPRGAFVAVGGRMVPCKSAREDGCFVVRVGIEVLIAEACRWRVESRITTSGVDAERIDRAPAQGPRAISDATP